MFTRWLLTVFPEDVRIGWRLLKANLFLWIVLATASALAIPISAQLAATGGHNRLIVLGTLTWAVGLSQAILCIPLFDDAYRRRSTDWDRARTLLIRRAAPFFLAATVIVPGGLLAAAFAMTAVQTLLQQTPVADFAVPLFGILVYVGVLVRFCYVPFLIVLYTRVSLPQRSLPAPALVRPLLVVLWPFVASSRLSEGRRWRLAPYIGLLYVVRLLHQRVPADLQIFVTLGADLAALIAQAILFRYFAERIDKERLE